MVGQHIAFLFDQVSAADPESVPRMNVRVETCYTWAETHGFTVVDEVIVWTDGGRQPDTMFAEVLAVCRRTGAVLLVHSVEVLPERARQKLQPGPADRLRLDGVQLVVATGGKPDSDRTC